MINFKHRVQIQVAFAPFGAWEVCGFPRPGVKTPGYSPASLRDESGLLQHSRLQHSRLQNSRLRQIRFQGMHVGIKLRQRCLLVAVAIAFLLLPVLHVGAAELSPEDAQQLREAQLAVRAKHFDEAVKLLEKLRTEYPAEVDIPRLLTHAYFGIGEYEKARKAALSAINRGHLTSDLLARLAQIDQQRDDRLALLNTVRLLTVVEDNDDQWRLIYGDLLAGSGALRESISVYQSLIEDKPDSAALHARLGSVLLEEERYNEAVSVLETAWHLGASGSRLPRSIAGAWQRLGDDRRAVVWLERAAAIGATDPAVALQLGSQLLSLGELDRAEKQIATLTSSDDPSVKVQAHVLLGQIAMSRDDVNAAIGHWQQATELGSDSPKLLKVLGAHYYNAGQFGRAAGFLRRAVEAEDGTDEENLRFLVISLIRYNDKENSREYLRQYIELYGLSDNAKQLVRSWTSVQAEQSDVPVDG